MPKIEATKKVGYTEQQPPASIAKPAANKNSLIGKKFWEELQKHTFVPNTAYSAANPNGHIPFTPASGSSGTASGIN